MKNIFKLSVMVLAAAFVAGCSQNDDFDSMPAEGDGLLVVRATASDFASSDAKNTRIVNEGANTTFESGDEIGVFAIRSTDNKLVCSNLPLEYKDATNGWTGNDNKVYFYKNTTYVAYSPYDKNLSISDAESAADLQAQIKAHFDTKLENNTYNQLTMYPSLDLMLATAEPETVEGANDKALSFSFKHQMALVEIAVPVKAYLDESKAFTYAEPFTKEFTLNSTVLEMYPLSIQTTGAADEADAAAYSLYRFLVKPATDYTLSGELEYAGKPVTLDNKAVNLSAGTYMKYTIQATNAVSSYTKRAIAVGDYYYADGSIYPGTSSEPLSDNCVGIIFNTTTTQSEQAAGFIHGQVLALENINGTSYCKWSQSTGAPYENNVAANDDTGKASILTSFDGYMKTNAMVDENYTAIKTVREMNPGGTTGWYLPSAGQLVQIFANLAEMEEFSTVNVVFSEASEQTTKGQKIVNLKNKLEKVGGVFYTQGLNTATQSERWWSTTEVSNNQTWAIEMKSNGQVKLLPRDKTANNANIRPVLAF